MPLGPFADVAAILNKQQAPVAQERPVAQPVAPPSLDELMQQAAGSVRPGMPGIQPHVASLPGWAQSLLKVGSMVGYKPQGYTMGNNVLYNPAAFEGSNPTDLQNFLTHEFTHVRQNARPGAGTTLQSTMEDLTHAHDDRAAEIEAEQAVRDRTHAGKTYRAYPSLQALGRK